MCITFSSNINRGNHHGIILIMNLESEWNNTVNKIQIILSYFIHKDKRVLGAGGEGTGTAMLGAIDTSAQFFL